jgi:hypothetical protein
MFLLRSDFALRSELNMNTPTPQLQSPPSALDLATIQAAQRAVLDTIPRHKDATANEIATQNLAAMQLMADLRPRDPLQVMFAGRFVALGNAVMDVLAYAALADAPPLLKLRFGAKATSLSRASIDTLRELQRLQASRPAQKAELLAPMPAARPQPAPKVAEAQAPAPAAAQAPAIEPAAAQPVAPQPQGGMHPIQRENQVLPATAEARPARAAQALMLEEIAARTAAAKIARAA